MIQTPRTNKAYFLIAFNLNLAPTENLLENTKLTLSDLTDLDYIDLDDSIQFVHNLKKYSYTPNFSAIFGAHLGAASHGPVGYATLSAPTIGKALTTFAEWFHIRAEVYSAQVIESDEFFDILISDTTGDAIFKEFFFEAFIRAFEVITTYLIGQVPHPKTQLYFETQAKNRQALMKEEYDSTLVFGAKKNKLRVSKDVWYIPSPLYDKDSYDFNLRKCQQIMEQRDLAGRIDLKVRSLIRKHFEQAEIANTFTAPPTQQQICDIIFMSERTIIRRLKEFDTSYKKILQEERQTYSEKLLKQARYTIYDIAEIIGYRESANFCRAFKVWYGLTPSEYRRRPTTGH
jgi:AraC-like DNA-binding protein